jgi:hypothetical protein
LKFVIVILVVHEKHHLVRLVSTLKGSRKLAPLAPPVPDEPHLVGQNEI